MSSRNSSKGALFAAKLQKNHKKPPRKLVCEKCNSNWIVETYRRQRGTLIKFFFQPKSDLSKPFFNKIENYVHGSLLNKQKKCKREFKIRDLIRAADQRKVLSNVDTTNWSFDLYTFTEISKDARPKS